jgi:hypothetical protein
MKPSHTLLLPLLLLASACSHDPSAAQEVGGALASAAEQAVRTQPGFEYRLAAFDGETTTVELELVAAAGTTDSMVEVEALTVDGKAPAEPLPLLLGPVQAGERATAGVTFTGVGWTADRWHAKEGEPAPYSTQVVYRVRSSHALADAGGRVRSNSTTRSTSSAQLPLRVGHGETGHAEVARHLAAKR